MLHLIIFAENVSRVEQTNNLTSHVDVSSTIYFVLVFFMMTE